MFLKISLRIEVLMYFHLLTHSSFLVVVLVLIFLSIFSFFKLLILQIVFQTWNYTNVDQRAYLNYCYSSRIADAESLGCHSSEESLSWGGSIETHIPHNDIIFSLIVFRDVFLRINYNLTSRETLKIKEINMDV